MKKIYIFFGLLIIAASHAQTQDSLYVWKAGLLVHKQSIKTTDVDSITFKRPIVNLPNVTICSQVWSTRNLDVTTYSDGTDIPQVTDQTQWNNMTTGAWCYYQNNTSNGPIFGKLYNWYAVAGIYDAASANNPLLRKKLAPNGWHIPTDTEWSSLINCLDPTANGGTSTPNIAGGAMKEGGTTHWGSPNVGGTNSSGFTGLPGGFRFNFGQFVISGQAGGWWSSSEYSIINTAAWYIFLGYDSSNARKLNSDKTWGFSVRCVRN